jgi:hypothetical protein
MISEFFQSIDKAFLTAFQTMGEAVEKFCTAVFYPILSPIFGPINTALGMLPNWMANVCGIGLFVSAMIWVALILNPKYVNRGRSNKSVWTDLRLWTVVSMTPHVLVYFYFR